MTRVVVLLVAVCLVASARIPHADRQKPVEEYNVYTDWTTPHPATLEELMEKAAVVVEGTIARFRPHDFPDIVEGRKETQPYTAVALDSVTWIKPTTVLRGGPVEFLLYTTERDDGDRILRRVQQQEPAPKVGQRYLLFLNPAFRESTAPEDGPYWLARGAESAFLILDDIIVPAGQSALSKKLAGMSRTELVSQLRELAR